MILENLNTFSTPV